MAIHQFPAVPGVLLDDGVAFIFVVRDDLERPYQCGFMHWPVNDPTGNPPVPDLRTWVETVKYCSRNFKSVWINFDGAVNISYSAWWGGESQFFQVNWLGSLLP